MQLQDSDLLSVQEARHLLERATRAGQQLARFNQEQVDSLIDAMAVAVRPEARRLAELAVQETGRGKVEDKTVKNLFAAVDIYNYIRPLKTCDVVARNTEKGIIEIAVPVGVIAAILPTTNPTSTAIFKILAAVKGRNPIVLSPHPQAVKCCSETARIMAEAALQAGAPKDCILCMQNVTLQGTTELMRERRTRMILATGGQDLVRAAYSSGKPAFGVGPGNVPSFIERTADVGKAVRDILAGTTFDNGLLCSSEQSIVCDKPVEGVVLDELGKNGGYLVNPEEQLLLEKLLAPQKGRLNPAVVGQSARKIAEMAGFRVKEDVICLIGRPQGVGPDHPLSMEKLSPVLALFVEDGWEAGCERCIEILSYGGLGHTMSIHSKNDDIILQFGLHKPAYRICVNTPSTHGSVGLTTGVPPSMTLGCGTPGGNITSDNITPLHLINIRRVAYEKRTREEIQFETLPNVSPAPRASESGKGGSQDAKQADLREIVRTVVQGYLSERAPAPLVPPASDPPFSTPTVHTGPVPRKAAPARDFVCEADVRQAIRNGHKIIVNSQTVLTPSAREAAEGFNVLIWS